MQGFQVLFQKQGFQVLFQKQGFYVLFQKTNKKLLCFLPCQQFVCHISLLARLPVLLILYFQNLSENIVVILKYQTLVDDILVYFC